MEVAKVDLKPGARVRIASIGGDLRLTGSDTNRLEAQAGRRGGLRVKTRDDVVEVISASGCLVFLPAGCPVEIGTIGGDGRITDMTAAVRVGSVGGDLRLRRLNEIAIDTAGGDLMAQRVRGRIHVRSLGGDAVLDRIEGDVSLESVGGDVRVRSLVGSIQATAGGDIGMSLAPAPGTRSQATARGDLTCRMPADASARVDVTCGGALRIGIGDATGAEAGTTTVVLGAGEADVELRAAGDLALLGALEVDSSDLADSITSQVESALQEAEMEIEAEFGEGTLGTREIGEQVRRALDRALRPTRTRGAAALEAEPAADLSAERALILKMVADGRISAAEAEALFRALEAGA
ncbi:MAG TPA: hypothetical protein VLL77_05640 [Anaerolineales bacterium]|nr:hypothetical protein [Anaerolineales bacterium]